MEPRTYRLSGSEFQATSDKLEKLNERARKRGFNGVLTIEGTRKEVKEQRNGLPVTRIIWETVITGTPPSYEGWTFLAAIDVVGDDVVINKVPGVEDPIDRDNVRPGVCDHCQTKRRRKRIFIVKHDDGRQLQVGSTCIKDFLGWNTNPVFYGENDIDIDDWVGGFGNSRWDYDVLTVLRTAWALVETYGFAPASFDNPTKYQLEEELYGKPKSKDRMSNQEWADEQKFKSLMPEDVSTKPAQQILDFVLSDEFGDSDYAQNLRAVLKADVVDPKHFGLVASAPTAYARHLEREVQREAKRKEDSNIVNEYLGEVKQRLELDVTVRAIRSFESDWGGTTLYTLLTDDNHIVKWFSSGNGLGVEVERTRNGFLGYYDKDTGDAVYGDYQETGWKFAEVGDRFRIKGTVKKHEEYQDLKSTVLTRCTVVKQLEAAA